MCLCRKDLVEYWLLHSIHFVCSQLRSDFKKLEVNSFKQKKPSVLRVCLREFCCSLFTVLVGKSSTVRAVDERR